MKFSRTQATALSALLCAVAAITCNWLSVISSGKLTSRIADTSWFVPVLVGEIVVALAALALVASSLDKGGRLQLTRGSHEHRLLVQVALAFSILGTMYGVAVVNDTHIAARASGVEQGIGGIAFLIATGIAAVLWLLELTEGQPWINLAAGAMICGIAIFTVHSLRTTTVVSSLVPANAVKNAPRSAADDKYPIPKPPTSHGGDYAKALIAAASTPLFSCLSGQSGSKDCTVAAIRKLYPEVDTAMKAGIVQITLGKQSFSVEAKTDGKPIVTYRYDYDLVKSGLKRTCAPIDAGLCPGGIW